MSAHAEPATAPTALGEPTTPVPRRWVAAVSIASVGSWSALFGPIQVLLALQAAQLAPHGKQAVFGLVTGLGAAVAVVANPVFGALSDRTTSRFGRRLPWVAASTVAGAASLVLLTWAPDVAAMALGWCLAQAAFNAFYAALAAAVPDQVPRTQRGVVSGWLGLAQTAGIVVGTALAALSGGITAGYLACAALALVSAVPYLAARRDIVLPRSQRPALRLRPFLASFWIDPRRHPDFAWAFATRMLMKLCNAMGTLYLLYYLQDQVRRTDAKTDVLVLTALYAAAVLGTAIALGTWSDRVARRRPFVTASGVVMAVAAVILAAWPTWPGAITAAVVFGVGYGGYASVDFALLTEVLPTAADRGKDLGVINIADSLPQVLAPAVAAPIVVHAGGYPTLYAVAAAFSLSGGVLVRRIRSVR
ncbi:MAG TPA: MFS transporter [Streptosporangiales bacterium]